MLSPAFNFFQSFEPRFLCPLSWLGVCCKLVRPRPAKVPFEFWLSLIFQPDGDPPGFPGTELPVVWLSLSALRTLRTPMVSERKNLRVGFFGRLLGLKVSLIVVHGCAGPLSFWPPAPAGVWPALTSVPVFPFFHFPCLSCCCLVIPEVPCSAAFFPAPPDCVFT